MTNQDTDETKVPGFIYGLAGLVVILILVLVWGIIAAWQYTPEKIYRVEWLCSEDLWRKRKIGENGNFKNRKIDSIFEFVWLDATQSF